MHNQGMKHHTPNRTVTLKVARTKEQINDLQKRRDQHNLRQPITSGSQLLSWAELLGEK